LSRYNSGWFCHSWYQSYKVTLEIHFTLKMLSVQKFDQQNVWQNCVGYVKVVLST
jgi:hypothetical protein